MVKADNSVTAAALFAFRGNQRARINLEMPQWFAGNIGGRLITAHPPVGAEQYPANFLRCSGFRQALEFRQHRA